jgi:hypothetical protein
MPLITEDLESISVAQVEREAPGWVTRQDSGLC